jgi:hypothetical protein
MKEPIDTTNLTSAALSVLENTPEERRPEVLARARELAQTQGLTGVSGAFMVAAGGEPVRLTLPAKPGIIECIGYTADRRAIWCRDGKRFMVTHDARGRPHVLDAEPVVTPQDPPKPYSEIASDAVVTLSDGFNGHVMRFFNIPIETDDGGLVKLVCAEPGKEYMTAWKRYSEVCAMFPKSCGKSTTLPRQSAGRRK